MTRFVALFRAVNVAGHGRVTMAALRELGSFLGLQTPRTLLQTGNLIFDAEADCAALEQTIEQGASTHLGLKTDVMVRDATAWCALVAANPFEAQVRADPAHVLLLVLKDKALAGASRALAAAIRGREQVHVADRDVFAVYPDGIGRSKLTNAVLERHLGTRATGRNWNSVVRIASALAA